MKKTRKTTIFIRIFVPLFIVMLLQAGIFYASTVYGDTMKALNDNSKAILEERVGNRERELENQFTTRWSNLSFYSDSLNELEKAYENNDVSIFNDTDKKKRYLSEAYPILISMLRNNSVNGSFLILANNEDGEALSQNQQSYYGLCIRDYDLASGYSDKEDLLVLRAPSSMAAELGCSLDSSWDALFTFSEHGNKGDFFYKPLMAAHDNPGVENDNFAYLTGVHQYSSNDPCVVSYSIPLIDEEGRIYGVLGVELTTTYLASLLPYSELQGKANSAYMIVQYKDDDSDMQVLASNGSLFELCFDKNTSITWNDLKNSENNNIQYFTGKNDIQICGSKSQFTIYNHNTPFENEKVALVGITKEGSLFSVSQSVKKSLLYVVLIILVIGSFAILIVSRWLTYPITNLYKSVKKKDANDDTPLPHTEIEEIDQLIDAIEMQSKTINQTKAQSEFFMMISHELRTPLNAVVGYLNLDIEQHEKNGWKTEYVMRSKNAAVQLSNIADEMLDYTKITMGSIELNKSLFHVKLMMQQIEQTFSIKVKEKKLDFKSQIGNMPCEYLIGDRLRIELVIQNILDNAIKFTDDGGEIRTFVSEEVLADGQIKLQFQCKDTGKGMSKDFCNQICAPFNQSDKSYSRTHGGIGIGLYLSKYFIDAMNGTFYVESQIGKGSCFTVTMLLTKPNVDQMIENHVNYSHVCSLVIGPKEEDNRLIKDLLKRLQVKCDIFSEEEKALRRIKARLNGEYAYSLCILDESILERYPTIVKDITYVDSNMQIFICTGENKMMPEQVVYLKPEMKKDKCKILSKPVSQAVLFDAIMNTFGEYDINEKQRSLESFPGLKAMIVEDNPINADILTRMLKKMNVEVVTYANGKLAVEAYEKAETGTYQIIFMDIEMPVMNGYEATMAIRDMEQNKEEKVPIVAVSANAFDTDIEKSIASGMNEHIAKPVSIKKICDAIHKYCSDYCE